uniref:Carb-bd_dom_fam9 domain-containing protein n=1 Tax=Steinernema glaseri TaxID=37863 RepID=A0A1I8AHI2_9BILA
MLNHSDHTSLFSYMCFSFNPTRSDPLLGLEMLLLAIPLLVLSQPTYAFYLRFNGFYENFLAINFTVRTADVDFASSQSDINFQFGYVNEWTDEIVYLYDSGVFFDGDQFYQDTEISLFMFAKGEGYTKLEEACFEHSTRAHKRVDYQKCMSQPNLLKIDMYPGLIDPDFNLRVHEWLMEKVEARVEVQYYFNNGVDDKQIPITLAQGGRALFLPTETWLDGHSSYYLRASTYGEARIPMKEEFMPQISDTRR